jgi:hypothetical protein
MLAMFICQIQNQKHMKLKTKEQIENVETTDEGGAGRPTRNIQPPARLNDYERFPDSAINDKGDMVQLSMLVEAEPMSFEEALRQKHWKKAMIDELKSIEKNETWKLVHLPTDKKCNDVKWIFKTKNGMS